MFTLETWFRRDGVGDTVSTGTGGVVAEPLITKGRGEADGNNMDMNYFLGIDPTTNTLVADFEDTGGVTEQPSPVTGTTPIVDRRVVSRRSNVRRHDMAPYLNGELDGTASDDRYAAIRQHPARRARSGH